MLACELADAMFESRRLMTAKQLYQTLASAFATHTYRHPFSHLFVVEAKPQMALSGSHVKDMVPEENPENISPVQDDTRCQPTDGLPAGVTTSPVQGTGRGDAKMRSTGSDICCSFITSVVNSLLSRLVPRCIYTS